MTTLDEGLSTEKLLISGGHDGSNKLDDVFVYDGTTFGQDNLP